MAGSAPAALGSAVTPQADAVAAAVARRSAVGRLLGWFWRGRELKQLKLLRRSLQGVAGQLEAHATLLFACAERTLAPAEPLPSPGEPVAAELYRQAAYWAVRGLSRAHGGTAETRAEVWSKLEASVIERVAGTSGAAELEQLVEEPNDALWRLAADEQAKVALRLRKVAKALLDELQSPTRARETFLLQRLVRIGGLLALVAVAFSSINYAMAAAEERRDLAINKPWRTSSIYANLGCTSPVQQCSESPDFFFHTREESNAWLEIDLGVPSTFSQLRVINRRDCCFERAVPLIVEVSNTQENFHEVARRTSSFSSWLASFPPTKARYVRLRTPSRNSLHLAQVRVLR